MKGAFEALIKHNHPKAVGLGFNYHNPRVQPGTTTKLPKHPVVFQKSLSSLVHKPTEIKLDGLNPIYHEVELGVVIGKKGRRVLKSEWSNYVAGYFVLIDFTLKAEGLLEPNTEWFLRKGMDNFFIAGDYIDKEKIPDPHNVQLSLSINGEEKQNSSTKHMIFNIPEVIEYTSKFLTLNEGDLILTGTPPGAGNVSHSDHLTAELVSEQGKLLDKLDFRINISK